MKKLKNLAVAVSLVVLGIAVSSRIVNAQESETFDFARAYEDYVFTLDTYNDAHSEYVLARAQFLQAGTLVSQTKARESTAAMLIARDNVVITYLTALRLRLAEAENVSDGTKQWLYNRMDSEIDWYQNHRDRISSAGSLSDLVSDSKEAESRFKTVQSVAYEVLVTIPTGKVGVLRSQLDSNVDAVRAKISEIRASGSNFDVSLIDRWTLEIDNKIVRSLDKEIEAQTQSASLFKTPGLNSYNSVIFKLQESLQFMREGNDFMKEIIRTLRST